MPSESEVKMTSNLGILYPAKQSSTGSRTNKIFQLWEGENFHLHTLLEVTGGCYTKGVCVCCIGVCVVRSGRTDTEPRKQAQRGRNRRNSQMMMKGHLRMT